MQLARLKPLRIGRLTRAAFGTGTLVLSWMAWPALMETTVLVFLGVSFVIGGVAANPGCEITAIPNLLLPERRRLHSL